MKKIFELDINDDFRRARISQFVLMLFIFLESILTAVQDLNAFTISYLAELVVLGLGFNFYFEAQKNRNYAYWTISIILFVFILFDILKYTFVDYNILILYVSFLSGIFLFLGCYVMSSPLFFPRVQWWEYDFRYRGDLKSLVKVDDVIINSRITDIRRQTACVEIFEFIPLDKEVILEIDFDDKNFSLPVRVKTAKRLIPGRPFRYGVKFDFSLESSKKSYNQLLKIWNRNKKVRIRNKFSSQNTNETNS